MRESSEWIDEFLNCIAFKCCTKSNEYEKKLKVKRLSLTRVWMEIASTCATESIYVHRKSGLATPLMRFHKRPLSVVKSRGEIPRKTSQNLRWLEGIVGGAPRRWQREESDDDLNGDSRDDTSHSWISSWKSSVNHSSLSSIKWHGDKTWRHSGVLQTSERQTINYINFMLSSKSAHKEKLFSSLIASQLARNVRQITWELWLAAHWQITDSTSFSNC